MARLEKQQLEHKRQEQELELEKLRQEKQLEIEHQNQQIQIEIEKLEIKKKINGVPDFASLASAKEGPAQPVVQQVIPSQVVQPIRQTIIVRNERARPDRVVTLLLWLFLGGVGGHRFYVGDSGMGALILCSFFLVFFSLGFWAFIHVPFVLFDGLICMLSNKNWR